MDFFETSKCVQHYSVQDQMQIAIEVSSALQSAISVPTSRLQTRSLTQNQDFDEDFRDLIKRILGELFLKKM